MHKPVESAIVPFRKKMIFHAIMALIIYTSMEGFAYLLLQFISKDYYYAWPTREEFSKYLLGRHGPTADAILAWLPSSEALDPDGARLSPAGESFDRKCVSLYGDSFTYAQSVSDEAAWGNQLARMLGCRVQNFGVSGYGTDQAYLRFLYNRSDSSPNVILGVMSENIVRNINQDRSLIYGHGTLLKPRFVLDGDSLRLVPMPELTQEDYDHYVSSPADFLLYEYMIPDATPLSKRSVGFPYSFRVPYIFTYKRIYMTKLARHFNFTSFPPWYSELYQPDHPSGALPVTLKILKSFQDAALIQHRKPIVIVLPIAWDIFYFVRTGTWAYQSMVTMAGERGINIVNVGDKIVEKFGVDALGDTEFVCELFCADDHIDGHYREKGNYALAEMIASVIHDLR